MVRMQQWYTVHILCDRSACSHGTSATATTTTIMGVVDTFQAKWVQNSLPGTGSVNTHCCSCCFEHTLLQSNHVVHSIDLLSNPF